MINVLVVDDHALMRAMVTGVLTTADGITVIGECADGVSVVSLAAALNPDVVVMDVQMPGRSGIDATRDLIALDPLMKVLILTGSPHRRWRDDSIAAGAAGFLAKSGDPYSLVSAVREVAAGGSVWL